MNIVHESGADGADTKPEGGSRDEPARANPFAGHVGRNFEDDVGDVEDGENLVVIVTFQVETFLEARELRVTCHQSL